MDTRAADLQANPVPGQQFVYACNSPDIAENLAQTIQRHEDDTPLQQAGACVGFPGGSLLSFVSDGHTESGIASVRVKDSAGHFPALWLPKEEVAPVSTADIAAREEAKCTAGGGEVDRLEEGRDGTLRLKRYMMTSKCINGQARAFFKPLN